MKLLHSTGQWAIRQLVKPLNALYVICHYIVITFALICSACDANTQGETWLQPPLKPAQTLDPNSSYAKKWPGKPSLVKLKDNLVLAIPPQYHQFWTQYHWLNGLDTSYRPPMAIDKLPYAKSAGFTMHMPDYAGYTPDNYLKDFDENRVEIVYIEPAPMNQMEPGAPGAYPPNQFGRVSTDTYRAFDPEKYEEKYGLHCFTNFETETDRQYCYGKRDSSIDEYLLLDVMVPPYHLGTQFPIMRTHYFSPRYGGLEIAWRTHMNNFPRWREIDAQIWKYIDAWNIAPKSALTPSINIAR